MNYASWTCHLVTNFCIRFLEKIGVSLTHNKDDKVCRIRCLTILLFVKMDGFFSRLHLERNRSFKDFGKNRSVKETWSVTDFDVSFWMFSTKKISSWGVIIRDFLFLTTRATFCIFYFFYFLFYRLLRLDWYFCFCIFFFVASFVLIDSTF